MQLLALLDDPESEARDIVPIIEADPAMTARVITLANSAFFGSRARAANAWSAVMVVGFNVVRALAAAGVLGIGGDNTDVPNNYYDHCLASAAGASVVAQKTRVRPTDAFSAALLHDIGALLLFRSRPTEWREAQEETPMGRRAILKREVQVLGTSHDEVAAEVLAYLHFPATIVEAAGQHNLSPWSASSTLAQVVIAGISLAEAAGVASATEPVAPLGEALESLSLAPTPDPMLFEQLEEELANLRTLLG